MSYRKTQAATKQDEIDRASGRKKTCRKCGVEKFAVEFYFCERHRDKRRNVCAACMADRQRDRTPNRPWKLSRAQSKHCRLCYGLSHRVDGEVCRVCGLEYAPQAPIELQSWQRREDPRNVY